MQKTQYCSGENGMRILGQGDLLEMPNVWSCANGKAARSL